jgi:hypothetical protein
VERKENGAQKSEEGIQYEDCQLQDTKNSMCAPCIKTAKMIPSFSQYFTVKGRMRFYCALHDYDYRKELIIEMLTAQTPCMKVYRGTGSCSWWPNEVREKGEICGDCVATLKLEVAGELLENHTTKANAGGDLTRRIPMKENRVPMESLEWFRYTPHIQPFGGYPSNY